MLGAGAVAEVPVVAQQPAVGVARGAAVEQDRVARADVAVAAGDRHRAGVDHHAGRVDRDGVAEPGAVVDGQRHREDAAARIGVGDDLAERRRRAVAEVPGVDQLVAVGVAGAGAVEGDVERVGDDLRPGLGHRRVVDPDRHLGGGGGVGGAAGVGDRELGAVHARRLEGALGDRARAPARRGRRSPSARRRCVPSGSNEALPSSRTGSPGATSRSGPGGRDRRRVDRDHHLVDVEGLGEAGVVAHGQQHPLQAGRGEGRAPRARPRASLPSGKRQSQSATAPSGSTEPEPSSTTSSPGAAIEVGAGVGDRRGVDAHDRGVAGDVERRAAVVAHDERDLVGAGPGVGVADVAPGRGRAVAEAPLVAGDRAVGVVRAAAVEGDLADRDRLVRARRRRPARR